MSLFYFLLQAQFELKPQHDCIVVYMCTECFSRELLFIFDVKETNTETKLCTFLFKCRCCFTMRTSSSMRADLLEGYVHFHIYENSLDSVIIYVSVAE